jgi:hypothetical protein
MSASHLITIVGPILLAIGLLAGIGLLIGAHVKKLKENEASLWVLFLLYTTGGTLMILHATGYL